MPWAWGIGPPCFLKDSGGGSRTRRVRCAKQCSFAEGCKRTRVSGCHKTAVAALAEELDGNITKLTSPGRKSACIGPSWFDR